MDGTQPPLKILLVEDSLWTVRSLQELIRQSGLPIDVRLADSEGDAVHVCAEVEPDLVILDLKLKQGNGFSVLRYLRSRQRKPQVIVLTNYALPKYRTLAALIGADRFLDKANEFEEVPTIIQSLWHARAQVGRFIDGVRDAVRGPAQPSGDADN